MTYLFVIGCGCPVGLFETANPTYIFFVYLCESYVHMCSVYIYIISCNIIHCHFITYHIKKTQYVNIYIDDNHIVTCVICIYICTLQFKESCIPNELKFRLTALAGFTTNNGGS